MKQFQIPSDVIFYRGDIVRYELECSSPSAGRAYLRTTLNNSAVRFAEIVDNVEKNIVVSGHAWYDLPMEQISHCRWGISIPLTECGVFESKCFFVPEDENQNIRWVGGGNSVLKVESPSSAAGNTIYTAFTRLFDFNKVEKNISSNELTHCENTLDSVNYSVIPPSGTFRQLASKLDFIMGELKCRILQLLPIHPAPVLYGRMGRFGSPFAATDYFAIDPSLADFDEKATPMEQFRELLDAVHAKGGRLFLDIPVNHTGWASKLQNEHPDYFVRREDGTFESPGAWGVVWEDLCKLDYEKAPIVLFMAKVFLFWCRIGVDGFRCDAGYMLPEKAWEYIVAKVRSEYQDTVFMLEGLGGPQETQNKLLNPVGLDWAYSELFQNYSKEQLFGYMQYMQYISMEKGRLVNFVETHDNDRIGRKGRKYARMRTALTALSAPAGAFGFSNGVEFLATEKIDVHGKTSLNWGAEENIADEINLLNTLLNNHPAFAANSQMEMISQNDDVIAFIRRSQDGKTKLLCLINLKTEYGALAVVPKDIFADWNKVAVLDGIYRNIRIENGNAVIEMSEAESIVFGADEELFENIRNLAAEKNCHSSIVLEQQIKAFVLSMYSRIGEEPFVLPEDFDFASFTGEFKESPLGCAIKMNGTFYPEVLTYELESDIDRLVFAGVEKIVIIEGVNYFQVTLTSDKHTFERVSAVKVRNGYAAVIRIPEWKNSEPREFELDFTIFENGRTFHRIGHLHQSGQSENPVINLKRNRRNITGDTAALHSNQCNSMSFVRGRWGSIESKYDAILAGNCSPDVPVDRRVMFLNLRAWVVVNDFSQALDFNVQKSFTGGINNVSEWEFEVPTGQGAVVNLIFRLELAENGNAVRIFFIRRNIDDPGHLAPEIPVKLILRPDVDDRINHNVTKAYLGAEKTFPDSVRTLEKGFYFGPDSNCQLKISVDSGKFVREDEWRYNQFLAAENYYGLEDHTDIFSPGYFEMRLAGGDCRLMIAKMQIPGMVSKIGDFVWHSEPVAETANVNSVISSALNHFVVKRDEYKTVIAGFPWFLDWGRDTLIVLRGLIDDGLKAEALAILRQFAKFEKNGTLPNMIRGNDDSNRDTTDASLWFFAALHDFADKYGCDILQIDNGAGRTLMECMESIVQNYIAGTPNGIKADAETLLIYSPPHFSWMDTNYPAATPREGYPIEIQALWYHALAFLGRFKKEYFVMAEKVAENFEKYFYRRDLKRYSDCIHVCNGFAPVCDGTADDHIRPNQLFAVTLGLVKSQERMFDIIRNCERLIIPGSIRSLADRPVEYELKVELSGQLLNNPAKPYCGSYNGPEDTCRKAAYHNGTAWGWVFPSYCEALYIAGGERCRRKALLLLLSAVSVLENGVPGQLPEIIEGNYPHRAGGCPAQAWSMSEFGRVYHLLNV
ncbi:MAG: glycogen debranching enzyme N-terminal domain-containing protein [Lentisphaeria bacterium]|nr:glycogen debranching enzyme N-terminal domain-containing protein [Lentisphaeria bacterium]